MIYNVSASEPIGWYRLEPAAALRAGDLVLTRLPADAAALADQRGCLPSRVPLLKRVGAVAPQHVCVRGGVVRIDGVPVAVALRADRWQRPLPQWRQCRRLAAGELFLLSTAHPASFDSRYYGPVRAADRLSAAASDHRSACAQRQAADPCDHSRVALDLVGGREVRPLPSAHSDTRAEHHRMAGGGHPYAGCTCRRDG